MVEWNNKGFEGLEVWQLSKELAAKIYIETEIFPKIEQFGLTNQIRRACVSIMSNIAEGSARGSDKDFARFISMALGSCAEVKSQLILASELTYLSQNKFVGFITKIDSIGRMLKALKNSILKKVT